MHNCGIAKYCARPESVVRNFIIRVRFNYNSVVSEFGKGNPCIMTIVVSRGRIIDTVAVIT